MRRRVRSISMRIRYGMQASLLCSYRPSWSGRVGQFRDWNILNVMDRPLISRSAFRFPFTQKRWRSRPLRSTLPP